MAVLVAAVFAWRARPEVEHAVPALAGLPSAAAGDLPAPPVTAPAAAEVVVAVTGKVNRPGLIRLPAGARVADAVKAAGGIAPGAPVTYLNLARKLVDGELIVVGISAPPPAEPAGPGAPGAGESAPAAGGAVNLNSATAAQLEALPGVGPVLAQRIVEHRQRHGAFRSVADLRRVDGIGATRFERLKALVTV
ncbi:hypothetical protein GCM10010201_29770 [Pilimelia columellifera subsp. columellifera]|uniref:Helix-hairpin-helix DNA-binding motif class 1 domain-containing protein n=1 Tax=Pilimelia columellifera subsp. columellifera TaxID=706583 RepID=A0ABP6AYU5_9ACTN